MPDPQAQRRVEDILDAATQVFAHKGYHRGTSKEIAATAGVSPGTIYNYFESKRALLLAMTRRFARTLDLRQTVARVPVADREFFRYLLRHQADLAARHRGLARAVLPEILVNAHLRRLFFKQVDATVVGPLQHAFEVHMAAGRIRPVDPRAASWAVITIFWGLILCEITEQPPATRDRAQITDELADWLFDGLAAT